MATWAVWVGSVRKGSYNAMVARTLPELAPAGTTFDFLPSVADFPIYDADIQAGGFPPVVEDTAARIAKADGLIIVTPEYNYSVPGGLKNAIDWVSRMPTKPLAKKKVLIQSASMGVFGGARAQYHLRQMLVFLDASVFNVPEVMVGKVQTLVADGKLTDATTRDFIAGQLKAFSEF
ncbi:NAD(P)H-dependent oxidoreductase [Azorhizobium oxalatiphilum]|uniref:NAD(P)H-dependent oxidoreductase n=1 Tax=Azorhizobium oxalatiphilum TaxID=980631 RepID=A0A917BMK7_9HYPH|nr:NADPH-dependent FMN reductase [Azorhizobium oxalatiphilum]GGF49658.1 NAD(P)H-dependent oxidoreductase [Azorhizobium oxalatiphilum]